MKLRSVLGFACGPLLSAALSVILLPLIAWVFTPEDIGRNNVFQIYTSFLIVLFILGLDQAYVREYYETSNRFGLLKACSVPGFVLLLIALLITLPFAGEISKSLYGEREPIWYLITAGCVILSFAARFLSLVVRMQERGLAYSVSQVLPKLVLLAIIAGFMVFGSERNFISYLYANLFSILLSVLVFGWNTRLDWIPASGARVDRAELKKLFQFGVPLIGAGVAYWALSATSAIALRAFAGFKELGIYSMSVNFAGIALIFQGIFSTVWMPTVYKWVANKEDLRKLDAATNYVLAAVCLMLAFVGMCSSLIDLFLPADYAQVKYIVVCCMVQPLLYTLSETTVVGLNIQRKSMHALGVAVICLVCNAAFNLLLVPKFGATGAAVSNALAYFIFLVARTEISARFWHAPPRARLYGSISTVLVFAISTALIGSSLNSYYTVVWFLMFALLLMLFKKEVADLAKLIGNKWGILVRN
jgi:O-antigen/teichoic acid export membrane protein